MEEITFVNIEDYKKLQDRITGMEEIISIMWTMIKYPISDSGLRRAEIKEVEERYKALFPLDRE